MKNSKKILIVSKLILALTFISFPTKAVAIQGLSGSTWGQLYHDLGDKDFVGSGAMGFINQGIDWTTLPGGITFNTFGEFRYRRRSRHNDFYNAHGPALGVEFKKSPFRLGADYYWETFPEIDIDSDKLQYYLNWYYGWDIKKAIQSQLNVKGLSGFTWGQITHDVDDLVGSGAMGFINQGIDWTTLPGGITFNTFGEFRYRLREKNKTFYNVYGPAAGIEFRKSAFNLGVAYYWERFPELDESSNKPQLYLTYYFDWDLKQK